MGAVAAWPTVFWLCCCFLYVQQRLSHLPFRSFGFYFYLFYYFTFFLEKSLPWSCLCFLCLELPLGRHIFLSLPLSPSSLTFRNSRHGSHVLQVPSPRSGEPTLVEHWPWPGRVEDFPPLPLPWSVCLYPTINMFGGQALSSLLPGDDDMCRPCESELSLGILLGISSAFVAV